MPLCTLHLVSLHKTTPTPLSTFLSTLQTSNIHPLIVSRVIRWIILPKSISTEHLLARNISWDVLLLLLGTSPLPPELQNLIQHHWHITAGVPSRLVEDFDRKNSELLYPSTSSTTPLLHSGEKPVVPSSQNLELGRELNQWIEEFTRSDGPEATGAVSMFNLLAFNPGMKAEYLKYGKAFADTVGSRHGGTAKIVGNVVKSTGLFDAGDDGWDEVALAHYPSIRHFRDMLVSRDYQEVNWKYRVGSLRDTGILMTSEVGIGAAGRRVGARL